MNTQTPTVSVIVPTYNRETWLPVSIPSVQRQTFPDWELILVDDHSTDQTRKVVDQYVLNDSRIRYIRNERKRGPAGARNHGIQQSKGRFVAFLDSDDEWEDFHLSDMVYYLTKYPERIDVMTANPIRMNRSTRKIYCRQELDVERFKFERLEDAYLFDPEALFQTFFQSVITTQTMVVRREVFDQIRFDEDLPPGPEDVYFHINLAYHKKRIAHLQKFHVTYWSHDDNLTMPEGRPDPEKTIRLYSGYIKANLRIIEDFPVNKIQRKHLLLGVSKMYFWKLGYNGFMQLGDYRSARTCFLKAIRLEPFNIAYWKTLFTSCIRQFISDRQS